MKIICLLAFTTLFLGCRKEDKTPPDFSGVWRGSFEGTGFQPITFTIKGNKIDLCTTGSCSLNNPEVSGTWDLQGSAFRATFIYSSGETRKIFGSADSDGKGIQNTYLVSSLAPGAARTFWIAKD